MVRALASHQCGPGSIPGPGVICGLSLLLVLVPAPRVFLRVLRFSSLHKNQHFQIPIRSGIRGPQVCQSRDCYVLPSLNKVFIIIITVLTAILVRVSLQARSQDFACGRGGGGVHMSASGTESRADRLYWTWVVSSHRKF